MLSDYWWYQSIVWSQLHQQCWAKYHALEVILDGLNFKASFIGSSENCVREALALLLSFNLVTKYF